MKHWRMHKIFQSALCVIPMTLLDTTGLTPEKGQFKLPTEASEILTEKMQYK